MINRYLLLFLCISFVYCENRKEENSPTGLMIDLLTEPQSAVTTHSIPHFSWIVAGNASFQSAWQIIVASSEELINQDQGNIWDSGKVSSDQSVAVPYQGNSLNENSTYWWKVRTWNQENDSSSYSLPQQFNTGNYSDTERKWPGESKWVELDTNGKTHQVYENRNPIRYHKIKPISVSTNTDGNQFITFEKAAFGALSLSLKTSDHNDTIIVHLGEDKTDDRVNKNPGGSIIYNRLEIELDSGKTDYLIQIPRFISNYPNSQILAEHMPEVTSFRYVEIEGLNEKLTTDMVHQMALFYHFNDSAASFQSSDDKLNQIWELCKHTLKATPFMGIYIDGGARERMPYEADAYMQQVAHYCVDREFAIQRYTADFLIFNPSWPTEWHLHMVMMAWADFIATGDTRFLKMRYDELKKKTLIALAREDGLISTRTGLVTPEFLNSIHYHGRQFRDIVDWPQGTPANESKLRSGHGSVTLEGETDRFVFSDINTVVNAFHYRNLVLMEKIAGILGETDDSLFYAQRAALVKTSFNEKLIDKEKGIYKDGEDVEHNSLHANMFPVAFGLAPESNYKAIRDFLISRGMACSPGMSMYLFDALYRMGAEDYSLKLLTNETDRSWMNMIRFGTTITSEAWDLKYKQNMTWNHAWGAIPAYVIARHIFGIEAIDPAYKTFKIMPHPSDTEWAKIKHPTIRGSIEVSFENTSEAYNMDVTIPPNSMADVYIPLKSDNYSLTQNGSSVQGEIINEFLLIRNVIPGKHSFELVRN